MDIATLATFARVKKHGLSEEDIAVALAQSESLVLSEDKKRVRRATPLPSTIDIDERSIYAKGFPIVEGETTIESVTALFSKFGEVRSVRFRRVPKTHLFKGSVFVEFGTKDEATAVLDKEVKLSEDGEALILESKQGYIERKKEERKAKRKTKKGGKTVEMPTEEEIVAGIDAEFAAFTIPKDTVAVVRNIPSDSGLKREDFSAKFGVFGKIERSDFSLGDEIAYIRFSESDAAPLAVEAMTASEELRTFDGHTVSVEILGEEAAPSYWKGVIGKRLRNRVKRDGSKGILIKGTPAVVGEKRKAEDDASAEAAQEGAEATQEKKQKTLSEEEATASTTTTTTTAAATTTATPAAPAPAAE